MKKYEIQNVGKRNKLYFLLLQWLGDAELRLNMEGRLLLVHLMCKDMDSSTNIFMPCVAFRVAGSPSELTSHLQQGC